jgi:hypothetical protein
MNAKRLYLGWRYRKLIKRAIRIICSRLYRDTNRDTARSILVAGTGRSGTTWLADIIGSQISCRTMFEPFHSKQVDGFRRFYYFQYMRPTEMSCELLSYSRKIFTGDIRDQWIDRQVEHILPRYRLIKEIRANLFLRWIHEMFPEVPLLFVVRHPCAVVLSQIQLGWATDTDIDPFLSQPDLIADFLANKMDIIEGADTVEEKHAIIWSISNLIPMKQFDSVGLNVIFYENLCVQPEAEIPRVFQVLNFEYQDSVLRHSDKPSTTAIRTSAIVTGDNRVTRWKKELSPKQIERILSVVEDFDLDYLYGDSVTPLVSAL